MIEMGVGWVALIIFASLLIFLFLGAHVAFTMGGLSLLFGFMFWGVNPTINSFITGSYSKVMEITLTALPLYIFMAAILRYGDLADDMYELIYRWFGGVRGGLAAGTTIISSIFAAMVGIAAVATATLGLTARPSMLKRGYNDKMIAGTIIAGGGLGILIPPSIIMIIYATETHVSAGALFMAGIIPGIIATLIFIAYTTILCYVKPEMGPPIPKAERFTWAEKFAALRAVILPFLIIVAVIGSIYTGIATPTEAACIGVLGSLIAVGLKRKLTWDNIKKMLIMTVGMHGMTFWILIGAVAYSRIVAYTGVGEWFVETLTAYDINKWVLLILMQVVFFILGMFIDPVAILLMTAPLFLPMIQTLGFDMIWYGVLFTINMCMGFMTPPFGFSLFIFKGVAPDMKIKDIYASIWPFVGLYILVLALVMIFPQLALWLPSMMSK